MISFSDLVDIYKSGLVVHVSLTKFVKWQKFFPYMQMHDSNRAISFGAHSSVQGVDLIKKSYQKGDQLSEGWWAGQKLTSWICFRLFMMSLLFAEALMAGQGRQ